MLFLPSRDAAENLSAEGVPIDRMQFVGNVMIDTLCWALPQAQAFDVPARRHLDGPYAVATLHRPANVDDPVVLRELFEALTWLAAERIARVVCDDERFELDGAAALPPQLPRRAVAIPQPLGVR